MERTFKNKTKIVRAEHDKDNHFTCISNKLIQDTRLNVYELGIMLKILSNSDDYVLHTTYLAKQVGISQGKFNKAIKHLISIGYINKEQIQGGWLWTINEIPIPLKSDSSPKESTPYESTSDDITPDESTLVEIESLMSTKEINTNETSTNESSKNESNINKNKKDTNIFSGLYTGTSILGDEIDEIINKVNSDFKYAPESTQITYFLTYVKKKLEQKIKATGHFNNELLHPGKMKWQLESTKQRLGSEVYKSIEPLLEEYMNCKRFF